MGIVVKEWYSQAPIRGEISFAQTQKSALGSSFEYPEYTLSMACTHPIATGQLVRFFLGVTAQPDLI